MQELLLWYLKKVHGVTKPPQRVEHHLTPVVPAVINHALQITPAFVTATTNVQLDPTPMFLRTNFASHVHWVRIPMSLAKPKKTHARHALWESTTM